MPRLKIKCPLYRYTKKYIQDPVIFRGQIYDRDSLRIVLEAKPEILKINAQIANIDNLIGDYYTKALLDFFSDEQHGEISDKNKDEIYRTPIGRSYPNNGLLCIHDVHVYEEEYILPYVCGDKQSVGDFETHPVNAAMRPVKISDPKSAFIPHPLHQLVKKKMMANGALKFEDINKSRMPKVLDLGCLYKLYIKDIAFKEMKPSVHRLGLVLIGMLSSSFLAYLLTIRLNDKENEQHPVFIILTFLAAVSFFSNTYVGGSKHGQPLPIRDEEVILEKKFNFKKGVGVLSFLSLIPVYYTSHWWMRNLSWGSILLNPLSMMSATNTLKMIEYLLACTSTEKALDFIVDSVKGLVTLRCDNDQTSLPKRMTGTVVNTVATGILIPSSLYFTIFRANPIAYEVPSAVTNIQFLCNLSLLQKIKALTASSTALEQEDKYALSRESDSVFIDNNNKFEVFRRYMNHILRPFLSFMVYWRLSPEFGSFSAFIMAINIYALWEIGSVAREFTLVDKVIDAIAKNTYKPIGEELLQSIELEQAIDAQALVEKPKMA